MVSEKKPARAYAARTPFPAGDKVSAVLIPRPMGFLAVRLVVDGCPQVRRKVQFFQGLPDENRGEVLGELLLSDEDGVARLPRLVPVGYYGCEVEGQVPTLVPTVGRLEDAALLPLPINTDPINRSEIPDSQEGP